MRSTILAIALSLLISAASRPDASTAIRAQLSLAHAPALLGLTTDERADVLSLYQRRDFTPLWEGADGRPAKRARDAVQVLQRVADDGLDPADYRARDLAAMIDALASARQCDGDDAARFDVMLSADLLRFVRQVHQGRIDPRSIGFHLDTVVQQLDYPAWLLAALAGNRVSATAAEMAPHFAQYRRLRIELARYRALARDSTLPVLPMFPTVLHPGERWSGLPALHGLLVALGDSAEEPTPADSDMYAGVLVAAVARFQERHGLAADGVIGRTTQVALRTPIAMRVRQIELALERLRWLPDLGQGRLIVINIPMFRLWSWDSTSENQTPSLEMNVVVGRAGAKTPVLSRPLRTVVFRPYWNVPASIARNEILPKVAKDPHYLERERMEIVQGAGDNGRVVPATAANLAGVRAGALRVRQRPGDGNALGLIKFVFPNDFDVYMHGTPAQALFAKPRRDFSHGCIRLEDPVGLAEWVLKNEPGWSRDRIIAATHGADAQRVELAAPINVMLFYTTAVVPSADGRIHFALDLYSGDRRLDTALERRHGP